MIQAFGQKNRYSISQCNLEIYVNMFLINAGGHSFWSASCAISS